MLCTRKCRNDSDMMPFNTENNFDLICGAFSKTKVPHTKLKVFYMNIRGMSLKFVDSLSTAQHKQLLVFSAISLYSVMYQEYMCEK